jgi:hypothetical protein
MSQHNAVKVIVAAFLVLCVAGCGSSPSSESPAAAASSGSGGGGVMEQHGRLIAVLRDYQLPAQSVPPPARHPDPQVDAFLPKMMSVAQQQGLVFDGTRAASDGIVVVGRPGKSGKPILIAVAVYTKGGRVAMQDTTQSNGLDMREADQVKERYLGAL